MHVTRYLPLLLLVLAVGCTQPDENPNWNPKAQLPEWTYDAPFYYRPTEDLVAKETTNKGVPFYYTNSGFFFVVHPRGSQVDSEPRVGVWASRDCGKNWEKQGYYGVEQSHFLVQVEQDGTYWIRFTGPGQTNEVCPDTPQRIYVVDRKPPQIELTYKPLTGEQKPQTKPMMYKVGQTLVVEWSVSDECLADDSVRLAMCFAPNTDHSLSVELPQVMEAHGAVEVVIPPEAANSGKIQFVLKAADKVQNVGMAMTDVIPIDTFSTPFASREAEPCPATMPVAIQPAATMPSEPVSNPQEGGWPESGELIRGGSQKTLLWKPTSGAAYDAMELQFSSNDGRTWTTMAKGFTFDQAVQWVAPRVLSKNCRIRYVGLLEGVNIPVQLVISPRFTVDGSIDQTAR